MPGPKYVKDFEFPTSAGFSGSATDRATTPVRAYERRRFAQGGRVKAASKGPKQPPPSDTIRGGTRQERERRLGLARGGQVVGGAKETALVIRTNPTTEEDQESGGRGPLRRGYRKGGRMKKSGLAQACSKGGLTRKNAKKMGYAMGGPVGANEGGSVVKGHMKRSIPHQSAYEKTSHSHLAKGGRQRYNGGGEVGEEAEESGEMRDIARQVVKEHVEYPAPKGHRGLKRAAKGGFQRTPMYGK